MNERQRWIARSLALGETLNQIAEELACTEQHVRRLISRTYDETGLESHAQLVAWSVSQGLVTVPELQEAYSHVHPGPRYEW